MVQQPPKNFETFRNLLVNGHSFVQARSFEQDENKHSNYGWVIRDAAFGYIARGDSSWKGALYMPKLVEYRLGRRELIEEGGNGSLRWIIGNSLDGEHMIDTDEMKRIFYSRQGKHLDVTHMISGGYTLRRVIYLKEQQGQEERLRLVLAKLPYDFPVQSKLMFLNEVNGDEFLRTMREFHPD